MSADNWRTCPRCGVSPEDIIAEARAKYGRIPEEDYYVELRRAEEKATQVEDTLREDYEFYWKDDNTIVASYHCSCQKCGLKHSFKYESKIEDAGLL